MKTTLAFLLLFYFNFSLAQATNDQKETQSLNGNSTTTSQLRDSLVIKIDRIENFGGFGLGSGFVTAKRGYKFIGVFVVLSNPTKQEIDFDLNEIYLLDTVNFIRYKVDFVMASGPFTFLKKSERSLKPGKELSRKLVFGVPEDLKAQMILYRNSFIAVDNLRK